MSDLTETQLLALAYDDLPHFLRRFATASDRSVALEFDGLTALIAPDCPDRSLINGVAFDRSRPEGLTGGLERLASAYDEAGVNAWGVWLYDREPEIERALAAAGLKLDSSPVAMAAPYEDLRLDWPAADGVEVDFEWDPHTMMVLNALAYGLPETEFLAALGALPPGDDMFMAFVREGGEAIACALFLMLDDGDLAVYFVATKPGSRSRGLGRTVMQAGLREGAARGCTTTSLQASEKGVPLYLKLGYRDLGRKINLWEHRRAG
ncbi:MAG: GNAT family N-acetyltransferase [Actinobacteria bacterium]|nr:GNAT family N-acetyltransferase [Actinomycetota bacterium]